MKKQYGGVLSINDPKTAFIEFLAKSNIEFLTAGLNGVILTCTNNINSNYYMFRPGVLAKKVNKVIIKLCLLHDESKNEDDFCDELFIDNQKLEYCSVSHTEFFDEVAIYEDIVNASIGYFEPIAPTLLFSQVSRPEIMSLLYKQIDKKNTRTDYFFDNYNRIINNHSVTGVGLMIMECAGVEENFTTLRDYISTHNQIENEQAVAVGIYELLILGYYRFCHGDHHLGNILFSNNYSDYFTSKTGTNEWYSNSRAFIIDFGRANRFNENKYQEFMYHLFNFTQEPTILKLRHCIDVIINNGYGETNDISLIDHPVYSWLNLGVNNLNVVRYIGELINARNRSISNTIESTKNIVSNAINGAIDINDIKGYLSYDELNNITINNVILRFVIQHIIDFYNRPPLPFSTLIRLLQNDYTEESISNTKKGGRMYIDNIESKNFEPPKFEFKNIETKNIEYVKFIDLIKSTDLNELLNRSCFAILFILFSIGKLYEIEGSIRCLSMGLYPLKNDYNSSFKGYMPIENHQIEFEQPIAYTVGGRKKRNNKTTKKRKNKTTKKRNKKTTKKR